MIVMESLMKELICQQIKIIVANVTKDVRHHMVFHYVNKELANWSTVNKDGVISTKIYWMDVNINAHYLPPPKKCVMK